MTFDHSHPLTSNAHVATYTFAASTATFWGLHLSDVAVIVSTFAAICGALIQVMSYLDSRRERRRGVETNPDVETE